MDVAQAASNAVAGNVSGPVDLLAFLLRKAGVPVPEDPVLGTEWLKKRGLIRDVPQGAAQVAGETLGLLAPVAVAAKAPQIASGLLRAQENAAAPNVVNAGMRGGQRGVIGYDERFDPRVKERARLEALTPVVQPRQMASAPKLSLADLEGMPFITSMSDRTAAGGLLTGINDVQLARPVNLRGGQDFMFDTPGFVWASGRAPVKQITELAEGVRDVTGKDPLFLPWRMAPSGGDFAAMTGETMLSYAASSLNKRDTQRLDRMIKGYIPEWKGVKDDGSVLQFREASDQARRGIKNMMDVAFRERGGLGIGEARLAVADPKQYAGSDGQIMNVGRIAAGKAPLASGHPSYPLGIPGEGIGAIAEDINIFQLLPNVAKARGLENASAPRATDLRALQMKPYAGIIDAQLLKALGY